MPLQKVVEFVFTLVMLLFLSVIVLAVLVGITIVQQLASFSVGTGGQIIFIAGMFLVFVYIMKLIIDRIKEYNRYI
jgi:hypothetical protein